MAKLIWETLNHNLKYKGSDKPFFTVRRAKVPGGWLVSFERFRHEKGLDEVVTAYAEKVGFYGWGFGYGGLTFLPDPEHQWDGGSPR